jgi:hypothetical protein
VRTRSDRRWVALGLVVAVCGAGIAAAPAGAARPVKGARYAGESYNPHTGTRDVGLQVSGDGRSFSSRRRGWNEETGGSYMDFDAAAAVRVSKPSMRI